MSWWLCLLLLTPPIWVVVHSLLGLLLIPFYGVEQWRWNQGALEIVARRRLDRSTKIWFKPAAQTWGAVIYYASDHYWSSAPIRVHERVHVLQAILFGALYPVTYLLVFAVLYAAVKMGLWRDKPAQDDFWRAYYGIPWEQWAYATEDKFRDGHKPGAWGSRG